jgi:TetR/AcrR family transcriptional repressor of nem operon
MNAKTAQKERSHATILESAARLIREKGIGGARVADVMNGAGLTVGGFYAHFASKESLVDETLRRTSHDVRERLFASLEGKPVRDRLEIILKRYLSAAHRDEPVRGCALPAVVGEVGTTAPEYRAVLEAQVEALAAGLEAQLSSAHALPARQVALGLVALMYGGLSLARALRGTPLSNEMLRACRALGSLCVRDQSPT